MIARYLLPALTLAGATFVLLFVILSVPLWVTFIATGGVIGAYLLLAAAVAVAHRRGAAALAAAPLSLGGLVLGGGTLVVMYVVLAIALWISILGALGTLAVVAIVESLASLAEPSAPRFARRSESYQPVGSRLAGDTSSNGEAQRRHGAPAAA